MGGGCWAVAARHTLKFSVNTRNQVHSLLAYVLHKLAPLQKKTKDQGILFSRSALLPRSLRRMVKNIEINPWNTWKNHEKS